MEKIVITHDCGFYSNCSIRLKKIIDYYNINKKYPIVDSSNQWNQYKDKPGDITNIFFKENSDNNLISDYIDYDESKEQQFSEYNQLDFENLKKLIDKYFSTTDTIESIISSLIDKYNIDLSKTIGIYYRGNNKETETNLPRYEDMLFKLIEVKSLYPNHRILIQSDEVEFYDFILKTFPDSLFFDEVARIKKNSNDHVQSNINIGQRTTQAKLFHSIVLIISRCSKVILNSGNVGIWICLYRGNFDGVYQYLNHKEYIHGSYNKNYKVLDNNWIQN